MAENKILSLQQVEDLKIDKNNRILYSATHEEVLRGILLMFILLNHEY